MYFLDFLYSIERIVGRKAGASRTIKADTPSLMTPLSAHPFDPVKLPTFLHQEEFP
jgi:hypothetical protein